MLHCQSTEDQNYNNLVQGSIIMQRGAIKLLVVGKCQGYIVLKNGLEHFIFHVFWRNIQKVCQKNKSDFMAWYKS